MLAVAAVDGEDPPAEELPLPQAATAVQPTRARRTNRARIAVRSAYPSAGLRPLRMSAVRPVVTGRGGRGRQSTTLASGWGASVLVRSISRSGSGGLCTKNSA